MPKLYHIVMAFSFACVGLLFAILWFKYLWKSKSRLRSVLLNTLTCLFTLIFAYFILEFYFFNFPQSDQFGHTWSARRWMQKYWNPVNSLGYRDIEHSSSELSQKKTVVVLGDSFAAGYGINKIDDRFSNQLQKKLGDSWIVRNVARNGWGTQEEYEALTALRPRPDVIILTYYINDILSAAFKHGFKDPFRLEKPNPWILPFVRHSYLFNYYYWKIYRFKNVYEVRSDVQNFLDFCFRDKRIWETHKRELLGIVHYAEQIGAEIIFIGFPNLADIRRTKRHADKVARLFEKNKVLTVDFTPIFSGRKISDLVVNHMDSHPSPEVHAKIADTIYTNYFQKLFEPRETGLMNRPSKR